MAINFETLSFLTAIEKLTEKTKTGKFMDINEVDCDTEFDPETVIFYNSDNDNALVDYFVPDGNEIDSFVHFESVWNMRATCYVTDFVVPQIIIISPDEKWVVNIANGTWFCEELFEE